MAFPVEPDNELTYKPTVEDETAGNLETPADPFVDPDTQSYANEPDNADQVVAPVENAPSESGNTERVGYSPDNDLGAEPAFASIFGVPLEADGTDADQDTGDLYAATALAPTDTEYSAAPGVTPPVPEIEGLDFWEAQETEDFETDDYGFDIADDAVGVPVSYEIQGRQPGGAWSTLATVSATDVTTEVYGLPAGEGWTFRIRAVFVTGETGAWSAETDIQLPSDLLAPPTPTAPTVRAGRGIVTVAWDGLGANASEQPADYKHTVVWVSETGDPSTFTPIGLLFGAGEFMWTNAAYNVGYFFALSSLDLSGNTSGRSTATSVTLRPLVEEPDIQAELDRIDAETGGLITEAGELNDRLVQAEADLVEHDGVINNLNDVQLPALQGELDANEATVDTLKNTTIPALNSRLGTAETELDTTRTELNDRLDQAFVDIGSTDGKAQSAISAASSAQTAADNANTFAQEQVALLVARGQNLVRNGDFEAGQVGWNPSGGSVVKSVNARSGSKSMNITAPEANTWPTSEWVPSSRGRTYYVEYYVREGGTPDASGSVGAVAQVKTAAGGTSSFTFAQTASSTIPNFVFTKVSGTVTPGTDDIVAIRFAPWVQGPTSSSYDIDDFLAVDVTEAQEALSAAATAQARADSAHTLAGTAKSTADNALTMAGSKSVVMYSTQAPSGTASPGDTWRQVASNGDVIAEWRWTNSGSWLSQQITSDVISNLDVGKLTVGTAAISNAVIDKLWADVISARKITTDQLIVGQGTNMIPWNLQSGEGLDNVRRQGGSGSQPTWGGTDAVTPGTGHLILNADWVESGVATNTWRIFLDPTKSPWATGGFPVDPGEQYRASAYFKSDGTYPDGAPDMQVSIVWYTGDGSYIVTSASPASVLTWAWNKHEVSVTAPATAAYAHVYVRQNKQGNVRVDRPTFEKKADGGLIVTGSITGDHLEVNTVSAAVANVIKLNADAITAGTINTARLNTGAIAAATASIQKADVANLTASSATISEAVIDKLWADVIHAKKITADMLVIGAGNNLIPNARLTSTDGWSGWGRNVSNGPGGEPSIWGLGRKNLYSSYFDLEPGKRYRFEVQAMAQKSGSRIYVQINTDGSTTNPYVVNDATLSTTWRSFSGEFEAPAGVVSGRINVYLNHPNGTSTDGYQWFTGWGLFPMASGELIVDGAITATKIDTKAVTAGKIATNAITADKISSGAITAIKIDAQAVTAEKIATGAITADKIDAGAITTEKLDAKAVTTSKINGGAITAEKLSVNAVTASKIDAKAVTAAKIATGAITADKIDGGAIDGKVITGATVRTSSSSTRLEMNSTGMSAYKSGTGVFRLNGADGNVRVGASNRWNVGLETSSDNRGHLVLDDGGTNDGSYARFGGGMDKQSSWYSSTAWEHYSGGWGSLAELVLGTEGSSLPRLEMLFTEEVGGTGGFEERVKAMSIDSRGVGFNGNFDFNVRWSVPYENGTISSTRILRGYRTLKPGSTTSAIRRLVMGIDETTTESANLYASSGGIVYKVSSLSADKLDQQVVDDSLDDKLLSVDVKTWVDRTAAETITESYTPETFAEHEARKFEEAPTPETGALPSLRRIPGVVAEEVRDAGLEEFVTRDGDGELTGVRYDRLGVALIPVVRRQRDKIASLEDKVTGLEAKLEALLARVETLETSNA